MEVREVLFDCVKGKHTPGQMLNLARYFSGRKKSVVGWDPIYVSFFPTFRCNLSCDMCITHSRKFSNPFGQKPSRDLDFQLFEKAINRFKNALAVNFIGNGESLLNEDVFEMIAYASDKMKMYTFSGSNGIIVREYVEEIVNSPLTGFTISLNGHNPEEFNRMTGMPSDLFNRVCANVIELVRQRNARGSRLEILVSIILDRENYKHLEDMIDFAESLGVDRVLFFQFLPSQEPGFTAEERCLFSDDRSVLDTFARVTSPSPKMKAKISLPPLLKREENLRFCSVPFHNISIDGDGNVGGCSCQILDLTEGGKLDEQDAWNNAHFQDLRNRFIKPELPLLEPCKHCYNNSGGSRLVSNPNPLFHLLDKVLRRRTH